MPNLDQILGLLRALLGIAGTALVTKGVVNTVDWTTYSGAILMVAPIVWSMFVHTDGAKIAAVAAMAQDKGSPVQGLVMTATPEGKAAADSIQGIVVAGTAAATALAKS